MTHKNQIFGALLTIAGLTWLNPHVWVDMILIVSPVAQSFPVRTHTAFIAGVGLTSVVWFTLLGMGGKLASPFFENPKMWKYLDIATASIMLVMAVLLALGGS